MRTTLLLVGQEPALREAIRTVFGDGFDVLVAADARSALALLRKHPVSIGIFEVRLSDGSGLDLLRQVKRFDESIDVLMLTTSNDVETALEAMKLGAYDFITQPVRLETLKAVVGRLRERRCLAIENRFLREQQQDEPFPGHSPSARTLERRIVSAAGHAEPVLILGEPGTEKEAVAREIHRRGSRGGRPFVVFRCHGHGRDVLETELFGRRESVRGRGVPHVGKWEFASGGCLYLDQADRLPLEIQARLLTALRPPAGTPPADVRILASSNTSTETQSRWNEDWRKILHRHTVEIPPLRERHTDIPSFIERQLRRVCTLSRVPLKGLTREAARFLAQYAWPGNLRELEDTVEIMALTASHEILGIEDLPLDILVRQIDPVRGAEESRLSLKKARRHFERQYIRKVLEKTQGNQTRAAETLGLHRNTLLWKLRELQMKDDCRVIVEKRKGKRTPGRSVKVGNA